MRLRDYQIEAIVDTQAQWQAGVNNVCMVLPTGAGKTVTFASLIGQMDVPTMVIAHRQELVLQISETLAACGIYHHVIAPTTVTKFCASRHMQNYGRSYILSNAKVVVASVQTLIRRVDENRPLYARIKLWVGDESHHFLEDNQWGKAVALFPNAVGLGVTATPLRCDKRPLDGVFDALVVGPTMRDLITQGHLCDYRIFCPPISIDVNSVRVSKSSGEFVRADLVDATQHSTITGDVVQHYLRIAPGQRGITFAVDLDSAKQITAAFMQAGVPALFVSGDSNDRDRADATDAFRRGDVKQLVNVDLFGEGYDVPACSVVSMARPTQSYGLYCLDPDTEILTPDGWKRHDDVKTGDTMLAFDPVTENIEEVPTDAVVKRQLYHDETIVGVSAPHLDIRVSDKHRMLVKSYGKTAANWQFQEADKMMLRKGIYRIPVAGFGQFSGSKLSVSQLHMIGWYLSDGCVNKKTNSLQISQSSRKIMHLKHIRNAIIGCGFKHGEYVYVRKNVPDTHCDQVIFSVSKGKPRGRDKHLSGWGWSAIAPFLDKTIPTCFDTMTRDEFLTMLVALNLGDGSNDHSSLTWTKRSLTIACGDNELMANRIQAMCVVRGLRCHVSSVQYGNRGRWWNIHIKDKITSTLPGINIKDESVRVGKPYLRSRFENTGDDPAFVWCVSNRLGTLITRRRGRVAIMGNCQQFGRMMRPSSGKTHGIVIDHVGNVVRHGLPDQPRVWSLSVPEGAKRAAADPDAIPLAVCDNCMQPYLRIMSACPYCGAIPVPTNRSHPEFVDGDLMELDADVLAQMRGDIIDVENGKPSIPYGASDAIVGRQNKNWRELVEAQVELREGIAVWAGDRKYGQGMTDTQIHKLFWLQFGMTIPGAMALRRADAVKLIGKIT